MNVFIKFKQKFTVFTYLFEFQLQLVLQHCGIIKQMNIKMKDTLKH